MGSHCKREQAGQETAYSCPKKVSIFSDSIFQHLSKVSLTLEGHLVHLKSKAMATNESPCDFFAVLLSFLKLSKPAVGFMPKELGKL